MASPIGMFKKDASVLYDALKHQGWDISLNRRNRIRIQSPTGALVIASGTPSGQRWIKTITCQCRRAGLEI